MNRIRPAIKGRTAFTFVQKFVQKKGKLSTSHRYNLLPLLPSGPGGVQRELVVYDFPGTKIALFCLTAKNGFANKNDLAIFA